ncbi:hypothetical protein CR513_06298, partial [Mucuna pruriens]
MYDPVEKKLVKSHDVQFMEDETIEDIDKNGEQHNYVGDQQLKDGFDIPPDDDIEEEQEMSQDENLGDALEPPLVQLMRSNRQRQSSTKYTSDEYSAIHLGKNSTFHSRSKHIDLRYLWIRDALDVNLLELAKVHTDDIGVDMITKWIDFFGLDDSWFLPLTLRGRAKNAQCTRFRRRRSWPEAELKFSRFKTKLKSFRLKTELRIYAIYMCQCKTSLT